MQLTRSTIPILLFAALLGAIGTIASAATIIVTDAGDSGAGTLRDAITTANMDSIKDTIQFDASVTTITLTTALPPVTEPLVIDGSLNNDYVELDGATNSVAGRGLELQEVGCEVYGMIIHGFSTDGIIVQADDCIIGAANKGNIIHNVGDYAIEIDPSSNCLIQGNVLGLLPDGITLSSNEGGIDNEGTNVTIGGSGPGEGNVISGTSFEYGLNSTGADLTFQGNKIGSDVAGLVSRPNAFGAIIVSGDNFLCGGPNPGEGNLFAGGAGTVAIGVYGGDNVEVSGNVISMNVNGSPASYSVGIWVDYFPSSETVLLDSNIIGPCSGHGIRIQGGAVTTVSNNLIGIGIDGVTAQSIGQSALYVGNSAFTLIENNVIGNGGTFGIELWGGGVNIQDNFIGTDTTGSLSYSNNLSGIFSFNSASDNVIQGNVIKFNGGAGIRLESDSNLISGNTFSNQVGDHIFIASTSTSNTLTTNSIDAATSLPISFNGVLVANDALDSDSGANQLQNHPTIDPIDSAATTVSGEINSKPNQSYTIEVFNSPAAHSSGFGPGETYLGQTTVMTNGSGFATWSVNIPAQITGTVMTATATDVLTGDTSHFSPAESVSMASSVGDWLQLF